MGKLTESGDAEVPVVLQVDAVRLILQDTALMARYEKYNQLIAPQLYNNAEGIHGVSHVRRTLVLTLLMFYMDKLSDQQTQLLAYASVYHDIGRTK